MFFICWHIRWNTQKECLLAVTCFRDILGCFGEHRGTTCFFWDVAFVLFRLILSNFILVPHGHYVDLKEFMSDPLDPPEQ